jgi:hypothetical protein
MQLEKGKIIRRGEVMWIQLEIALDFCTKKLEKAAKMEVSVMWIIFPYNAMF